MQTNTSISILEEVLCSHYKQFYLYLGELVSILSGLTLDLFIHSLNHQVYVFRLFLQIFNVLVIFAFQLLETMVIHQWLHFFIKQSFSSDIYSNILWRRLESKYYTHLVKLNPLRFYITCKGVTLCYVLGWGWANFQDYSLKLNQRIN